MHLFDTTVILLAKLGKNVNAKSLCCECSIDDQYLSAGEGEGNTSDMHKSTSLGDAEPEARVT
jgi:hypothetical protein